jgi:hypothetical protein
MCRSVYLAVMPLLACFDHVPSVYLAAVVPFRWGRPANLQSTPYQDETVPSNTSPSGYAFKVNIAIPDINRAHLSYLDPYQYGTFAIFDMQNRTFGPLLDDHEWDPHFSSAGDYWSQKRRRVISVGSKCSHCF